LFQLQIKRNIDKYGANKHICNENIKQFNNDIQLSIILLLRDTCISDWTRLFPVDYHSRLQAFPL